MIVHQVKCTNDRGSSVFCFDHKVLRFKNPVFSSKVPGNLFEGRRRFIFHRVWLRNRTEQPADPSLKLFQIYASGLDIHGQIPGQGAENFLPVLSTAFQTSINCFHISAQTFFKNIAKKTEQIFCLHAPGLNASLKMADTLCVDQHPATTFDRCIGIKNQVLHFYFPVIEHHASGNLVQSKKFVVQFIQIKSYLSLPLGEKFRLVQSLHKRSLFVLRFGQKFINIQSLSGEIQVQSGGFASMINTGKGDPALIGLDISRTDVQAIFFKSQVGINGQRR